MVLLGIGSPLLGRQQPGFTPGVATVVAAAWLVVGGAAMMLKRRVAFWIALGAGLFVAATGVWGMVANRMIGLPFPSLVSLVAGLYICFRIAMAKSALGPTAPRVSIADQLDLDDDK